MLRGGGGLVGREETGAGLPLNGSGEGQPSESEAFRSQVSLDKPLWNQESIPPFSG